VLDIVVIVSDILYSDHIPIIFHILDHFKINNLSEPIEKFTDLDRFQNFASDLISPKVKIKSGVEADKAACDFSASNASAYRLTTSNITLSDINDQGEREFRVPIGHIVQIGSGVHPTSYTMDTWGVKLTTHLKLVPRSRKCGSIHPLPYTSSWRNA
jgi:hypothetical protein